MLKNWQRTGIAILLWGMLGACVRTQFLPTTDTTHEHWSGPVEILQEAPADREYEELGWLTGYTHSDWGTALKAMQEEAAERGANAIVLVVKDSSTQAGIVATPDGGLFGGTSEQRNLMAIAIRIRVEEVVAPFSIERIETRLNKQTDLPTEFKPKPAEEEDREEREQ